MPKHVPPLTASQVQNAKPQTTPYKLRDGGGLFLLVNPDGAKQWRMDYRRPVSGKQNTIGLGVARSDESLQSKKNQLLTEAIMILVTAKRGRLCSRTCKFS